MVGAPGRPQPRDHRVLHRLGRHRLPDCRPAPLPLTFLSTGAVTMHTAEVTPLRVNFG
jgi:hypothetical protein